MSHAEKLRSLGYALNGSDQAGDDLVLLLEAADRIEVLERQLYCGHHRVTTTTGAGPGQTSSCQDCGLAWRTYPARHEYIRFDGAS